MSTYYEWYYADDSGDAWGGYGYASDTQGYYTDYWFYTDYGWYYITYAENLGYSTGYDGYTEVAWVYDYETDQYGASDAWTSWGLETEEGYAYADDGVSYDWFGGSWSEGGYDPLNFGGGGGDAYNDVYIVWYYYDAATGDVWGGYGYADEADGYYQGEWWDAGTGWYTITGVTNLGYDAGYEGYAEATWGYDAQTGMYVDSDAWGVDGPGSEEGNAYYEDGTTDWFGGPSSEDGHDTIEYGGGGGGGDTDDVYIEWYYYDVGSGDAWGGYGYADEADGYYIDEVWNAGTGWYSITYVESLGYDADYQGYVEVTWGYDAQTDLYVDTNAWSFWGPGSEEGTAYYEDGVTDWFGGPDASMGYSTIQYDSGGGDGYDDVGFEFLFWDDGLDAYYGWGFVDSWQGYYADMWIDSGYGWYQILSVWGDGIDYGWEGYVEVTEYYDYETDSAGWSDAWGSNGLGSEYGYVYADEALTLPIGWFGYGGQIDADFV